MTRSIFDPTAPKPERSGSTFLGPDAANNSHMPENATDGVVELDQTDVMEVDASGDEASGVRVDSRSEPAAVVVEGETSSNPGQAAAGTGQSDMEKIAKAERELERVGKVVNPDGSVLGKRDDLSSPGRNAQ